MIWKKKDPDPGIDLSAFVRESGELFHERKMRIGFPYQEQLEPKEEDLYLRPRRKDD